MSQQIYQLLFDNLEFGIVVSIGYWLLSEFRYNLRISAMRVPNLSDTL